MGKNHKSTSHSEIFEIIKVRKKCCQTVDQAKKHLESIIRILKSSVWLKINIFRSEILDSISKEKKSESKVPQLRFTVLLTAKFIPTERRTQFLRNINEVIKFQSFSRKSTI